MLEHRQPPNILRRLSKARFNSSDNEHLPNGLYSCNDKIYKMCKLYLKDCNSFKTANDIEWIIKCHISCNSHNAIYYLKCLACQEKTTYAGETNVIRLRNRISKQGNSPNLFDNHVFSCKQGKNMKEPYFELYAFMTLLKKKDICLHRKKVTSRNTTQWIEWNDFYWMYIIRSLRMHCLIRNLWQLVNTVYNIWMHFISYCADEMKGTSTLNVQFNIINIQINHFIKTILFLESNHIFTTYIYIYIYILLTIKFNYDKAIYITIDDEIQLCLCISRAHQYAFNILNFLFGVICYFTHTLRFPF